MYSGSLRTKKNTRIFFYFCNDSNIYIAVGYHLVQNLQIKNNKIKGHTRDTYWAPNSNLEVSN